MVAAYADTQKAEKVLGWKAEQTLDQAIASAWAWEQKIRSYIGKPLACPSFLKLKCVLQVVIKNSFDKHFCFISF